MITIYDIIYEHHRLHPQCIYFNTVWRMMSHVIYHIWLHRIWYHIWINVWLPYYMISYVIVLKIRYDGEGWDWRINIIELAQLNCIWTEVLQIINLMLSCRGVGSPTRRAPLRGERSWRRATAAQRLYNNRNCYLLLFCLFLNLIFYMLLYFISYSINTIQYCRKFLNINIIQYFII